MRTRYPQIPANSFGIRNFATPKSRTRCVGGRACAMLPVRYNGPPEIVEIELAPKQL